MLNNTVTETIPQLIDRIVMAARAPYNVKFNGLPGMVLGSPGCGKSSAFYQAASRLTEITGEPWQVVDIRALLYDPVELKGLQAVEPGSEFTKLLKPDWARGLDPDGNYLLLFEEVTKALPSVQSALMQLILDRRAASFEFGRNWVPFATGNLATDRSGDITPPAALRDRFWIVIAQTDAKKWVEYATSQNWRPEVTSFVRLNPDYLSTWSSDDPLAFATGRSMEFLSHMLDANGTPEQWAVPFLGQDAGVRFISHCEMAAQLPEPEKVFTDPTGVPVMQDIGAAFYLAEVLAYHVNRDSMDAMTTYAARCQQEVGMAMVESAIARHPECKETKAYIEYQCKFDPRQSE